MLNRKQPMTLPIVLNQVQQMIVPQAFKVEGPTEDGLMPVAQQNSHDIPSGHFLRGQRLKPQRLARTGLGILGFVGFLLWARSHGVLLLATGAGMATMIGVYRLQHCNWSIYWSRIRQGLTPADRPLLIAVVTGGVVSVVTYAMVALLINTDNVWMAISLILQNGLLFAVAGLMLWQFQRQQNQQNLTRVEQLLEELTHHDPLKRLIAVRQLTHLGLKSSHHPLLKRSQLTECFQLMLRQEAEPLVRNGLWDGLQQFDQ